MSGFITHEKVGYAEIQVSQPTKRIRCVNVCLLAKQSKN